MEASMFNDTIKALGLQQHVNKPTHHQGNILDPIFTEVNSDLKASNCKTSEYLSDYCLVTNDTNIRKEPWERATKTICDTSKLTKENLINNFTAPILNRDTTAISHAINSIMNYEQCLTRLCQKRQSGLPTNLLNPGLINT